MPMSGPGVAGPEISWLEPIQDALVTPHAEDPAAIVVSRESLRLGLIACLPYLPARQRAVLILRGVLAFPAATMLGTSTVAVKSALQRARARLEQAAPAPDEVSEPAEPASPGPAGRVHRRLGLAFRPLCELHQCIALRPLDRSLKAAAHQADGIYNMTF
jgi:hypothetical protein